MIEKGLNLKEKIPGWFKKAEKEIIEDAFTRKVKNQYLFGEKDLRNIHIKLFDEDEKINRNEIISWNNDQGIPIFGIDRKKSKSKKFKRLGYHMIINNKMVDLDNSPELVKCKECFLNVSKKGEEGEYCLIYLNNQESRIIKKRAEGLVYKPYESLRNIMNKNEIVKRNMRQELKDELYNQRIDLLDKLIETDENFINFLKYSLMEEEREYMKINDFIFLIIENIKIKNKMDNRGKRYYEYKLKIVIRKDLDSDKEELKFNVIYEERDENEFKILLRGIILGILLIDKDSDIILMTSSYIIKLLDNFKKSSNRRKLDEELFLELNFLEKYMEEMNLRFEECDSWILCKLDKIRNRLKDELIKEKNGNINESFKMRMIDEAMVFNEFNLYLNRILILVIIEDGVKNVLL